MSHTLKVNKRSSEHCVGFIFGPPIGKAGYMTRGDGVVSFIYLAFMKDGKRGMYDNYSLAPWAVMRSAVHSS